MVIKGLNDYDIVNYKKPSLFLAFPSCTFKCEKECGKKMCQNGILATAPDIMVDVNNLIQRYLKNPITSAIVCGGLEPFDSWNDLYSLIASFRKVCNDDIVIYTGFYPHEIADKVAKLQQFPNMIVKFGRYRPNDTPHYDSVLGINLASDNQYASKIS